MPNLSINGAGSPARRTNARTGGRLLASGLIGALFIFCASAVGLVPPSVSAGPPDDPPSEPTTSPIRTFIPFDDPAADFYSFEVSDLEVYNLELNTSGADVKIVNGVVTTTSSRSRGCHPAASE